MNIDTINPKNGQLIKSYEQMSLEACEGVISSCHQSFKEWNSTTFETRSELMRNVAGILRKHKDEYATLIANEMGKVFKEGALEIEKCAWVCEYYSDKAKDFLKPQLIESDASKSFVIYNPLGVILAVMPWNFPFWQVFRFAVPAIMAGNTVVLKHASNVPGCALAIEDLFRKASFPENAFRALLIAGNQVAKLIAHPKICATTLTGSASAGRSIGSSSGYNLKKSVLELGGSDPYIILEDADIELAAFACTSSRLMNTGQVCIAAKRYIVVEGIYDQFIAKVKDLMSKRKIGDPLDPETDMGPMARIDLRDQLHGQVKKSVAMGAKLIIGGEIPKREGAYYPPTVLTEVTKGMPAYDEELFGPVAAVIRVKDEKEAIKVANDTVFGLGAAIFSKDIEKAEHIAAYQLEAGCCFVNSLVKSDPRLPFGGIKESGYGRELSSQGIKEFVNTKTVYVK